MPRTVPSQAVDFIANIRIHQANDIVRINCGRAPLSAALKLIRQIPDELLTMDRVSYASLIEAVAQIEEIIATWAANKAANQSPESFSFGVPQNPLEIIRRALAQCPDESPAPSTSELSFISDGALRTSLRNDIGAINRALYNSEWKAATVLAGSSIEALLLWALQKCLPADVTKAVGTLKTAGELSGRQSGGPLDEWHLDEYIKVAEALGLIEKDTAIQSKLAKDFRNLIHPGRAQRLAQKCDRAAALSAVAGVEHVIRDLTP